ncbi:MAG: phosphotransferase [Gemmataceae bacterium]|nr:phosphotransferase [Gemmataceae bacterium]
MSVKERTRTSAGPLNLTVSLRWQDWMRRQGLTRPEEFIDLPGDIVSGHRDRHVRAVELGRQRFFLKVEHRVSRSIRLHNWWDGFGAISLSAREAETLRELRRAGVPVPRVVAHGADEQGREFLLLRRVRGRDLRSALRPGRMNGFARWRMRKSLGEAIARVHRAGFDAPDLSAKHVCVRKCGTVVLLDWPRATRRPTLDTDRCLAALAGLHASAAPRLASPRDRMAVLKAWMGELGFWGPAAPLARRILQLAIGLGRRRSIREQLQPAHSPRLRWLAGEALCVTREYHGQIAGNVPAWLLTAAHDRVAADTCSSVGRAGVLHRFPNASWLRQVWARVSGRPLQSRGIQLAGWAFRLMRHKVPVAPVLAFGGRADGGGFLLTKIPGPWTAAKRWLAVDRPGRAAVLRDIGRLLRGCHDAGSAGVRGDQLIVLERDRPRIALSVGPRLGAGRPGQAAAEFIRVLRELGLTRHEDRQCVAQGYNQPMPMPSADESAPREQRRAA